MSTLNKATADKARAARIARKRADAAAYEQRTEADLAAVERIRQQIDDIKFNRKGVAMFYLVADLRTHAQKCKALKEKGGLVDDPEFEAKLKAIVNYEPVKKIMSYFRELKETYGGPERWLDDQNEYLSGAADELAQE